MCCCAGSAAGLRRRIDVFDEATEVLGEFRQLKAVSVVCSIGSGSGGGCASGWGWAQPCRLDLELVGQRNLLVRQFRESRRVETLNKAGYLIEGNLHLTQAKRLKLPIQKL